MTDHDKEYEELYKQLKRGNFTGLLGMFFTSLYAVILVVQANSAASPLVSIVAIPHMVCVIVAAVFSIVGYYTIKPWALLTAGILMAISIIFMPSSAKLVIIPVVLLIFSYIRKVTGAQFANHTSKV